MGIDTVYEGPPTFNFAYDGSDEVELFEQALLAGFEGWEKGGTITVGRSVRIPAGSKLNNDLNDIVVNGSGLSFSDTLGGGVFEASRSTFSMLPSFAGDVSRGDTEIVFSSSVASSLQKGDRIVIDDPTDGSWSNQRSEYRHGEIVRVSDIGGDNVTVGIVGQIKGEYPSNVARGAKIDNPTDLKLRNLNVISYEDGANRTYGFRLETLVDSRLENLRANEATYAGSLLGLSSDCTFLNCDFADDYGTQNGGEYGAMFANSQNISIQGGRYTGERHGLPMGGFSTGLFDIINRNIRVDGATIKTSGTTVAAADIHGNAEDCHFTYCTIEGGALIRGDNCGVSNSTIMQHNNLPIVQFDEIRAFNLYCRDNTMEATKPSLTRGLIFSGGNGLNANTVRGGTLKIKGNTIRYSGTAGLEEVVEIANYGCNETNLKILYDDNTFETDNGVEITKGVTFDVSSGSKFKQISITNIPDHEGGYDVFPGAAKEVIIEDVYFHGGYFARVQGAEDLCLQEGVLLKDMRFYSGFLGESSGNCKDVIMKDFKAIDCFWDFQSSSTLRTSLVCWRADRALVDDIYVSNRNRWLNVADDAATSGFVAGDVVTGGTSGATATVYSNITLGVNEYIAVKTSINGTFVDGEALTSPGRTGTTVAPLIDIDSRTRLITYSGVVDLHRSTKRVIDASAEKKIQNGTPTNNFDLD